MDDSQLLLKKISAIHAINNEIIARIKHKPNINRQMYYYDLDLKVPGSCKITEKSGSSLCTSIIQSWKPPSGQTLKTCREMNFFNDNLDYENCKDFDTVVTLNEKMMTVAEKFGWLDPSKSPGVLRLFLHNFEVLQTFLGNLESDLVDTKSKFDKLQNKVNTLNQLQRELIEEVEQINRKIKERIELDWDNLKGDGMERVNETKLLKKKSSHCSISAKTGFKDGQHKWSVLCTPIDDQGWLLIGVHRNPKKATTSSYNDTEQYGLSINKTGDSNSTYLYEGGKATRKYDLYCVPSGGIVEVILDCQSCKLTISFEQIWKQIIQLPPNKVWYPHFNPHGQSFEICNK